MPPSYFPLRWESTGEQWWFASPIDWAAANGCYDLVTELLHLDTNLLIKLTSLRRIRRLETVWDDEEQFDDVARCRCRVAKRLLLDCESEKGQNSLLRAGYGGWLLYTAASAGDVEFAGELLERDPLLVFGEGEYGVTDILYAAARSKNTEVFKLLLGLSLSAKVKMDRSDGKPDEIHRFYRREMMNRAVHAAARGGHAEMLSELLEGSSDVLNYRDAQGSTVLHTAAARGQLEVLRNLLESYDIITSRDNQGNTALNVAAYNGNLAAVRVLITASPTSASLTNSHGNTFLHMAVLGFRASSFRRLDRHVQLIKEFMSGKVVNVQQIINVKNNDGRTVLHLAISESLQTDVVELFMSVASISLNVTDAEGMTPLDLLQQRPRSASSEILIKRLISAGGISSHQGQVAGSPFVSHPKIQGIVGSPGTSFRIHDADMVLYTGAACSTRCDATSAEYCAYSGEQSLSHSWGSRSLSNSKLDPCKNTVRRLKILLQWPRKKEHKAVTAKMEDSSCSFDTCSTTRRVEDISIPLRQRFSKASSLPGSKRVLSFRSGDFPSPSTRRKFAAGLMHGVVQVMPQKVVENPSSPVSESSWSSPNSIDKKDYMNGSTCRKFPSLNHYLNGGKSPMELRQASFDKRVMNKFFCFGAQALGVEDSVVCR